MITELVTNIARDQTSAAYVDLMGYTIAMCHGKVVRRFKHNISVNCMKCLTDIKAIKFKQTKNVGTTFQYSSDLDFMHQLVLIAKFPEWKIPALFSEVNKDGFEGPTVEDK